MTFHLPAAARPTGLAYRVADLERMIGVYGDLLGLPVADRGDGEAVLAPGGGAFDLTLVEDPEARPRPYPCVGLYHVALLVPDRAALARVLRRLFERDRDADARDVPFEGFADHGVSEAAYLRDPGTNGIEVYRDRPAEAWPRDDDGMVAMVTERLDVRALLEEAGEDGPGPLDPTTRLGHVHLHVPDLAEAERFYGDGLGLQVTQRSYRGALFLSAGGPERYHHHVAVNVWAGDRRAPEGAAGLERVEWTVPEGTVEALAGNLEDVGIEHHVEGGDVVAATDPAGIEVRIEGGG